MANKAVKNTNLFFNIMTSGKALSLNDESKMDSTVRYIILNAIIFLGSALLFVFSYSSYKSGAIIQAVFDLAMGIITLVSFALLRSKVPFIIPAVMSVFSFAILCAFLTFSGGVQGSGVLWIYSFPLISIFILGMRGGILLSVLLLFSVMYAVFVPGAAAINFESSFAARTVGVYLLVLICTIVYEQTKITKDQWVARLTRALQSERDEIAVMKDNLKVGLFLINQEYSIQPQYSAALEEILCEKELSEKNFLDLLQNSIQQKERDTLCDFFSMVFNRAFDAQMLEDINPLHEFKYVSVSQGIDKTLRCTFAPINREDGNVYILATVEDISREVELQKQLSEEESKRNEEMRALFEVIHVEPSVLNDFIEDAEYEFQNINDNLKQKEKSSHAVIVEIYQSIHAIKSNAAILGLKSFSTKLHELEDKLRVMRESRDISFQDILHITVELDSLMSTKDSFKGLIDKIKSFTKTNNKIQDEQVLIQTLEKVVSKASLDLGKKAHLIVKKVHPSAMEHGPRRIMKEVLMQLVRNAVYHGIESPEARLALGKEESGAIHLVIDVVNEKIVVQLTDDGKGLDFTAIREKAIQMKLANDDETTTDRNALLQVLFSPGFTTAASADMYAGRGIGLNLVKERVKEMKGTIKLQSEEGKGTVFKITIPYTEESSESIATA